MGECFSKSKLFLWFNGDLGVLFRFISYLLDFEIDTEFLNLLKKLTVYLGVEFFGVKGAL